MRNGLIKLLMTLGTGFTSLRNVVSTVTEHDSGVDNVHVC